MLLAAIARPERVVGLVGIAAAPDFTSWGYSESQKMTILREGKLALPAREGEPPLVVTRAFWESAEGLRLMHAPLAIHCPIRLLHGLADEEVPWTWSVEIMNKAGSADVQTVLVKDGDHRLSRDGDLKLLISTVSDLVEGL